MWLRTHTLHKILYAHIHQKNFICRHWQKNLIFVLHSLLIFQEMLNTNFFFIFYFIVGINILCKHIICMCALHVTFMMYYYSRPAAVVGSQREKLGNMEISGTWQRLLELECWPLNPISWIPLYDHDLFFFVGEPLWSWSWFSGSKSNRWSTYFNPFHPLSSNLWFSSYSNIIN